MTTSEQQKPSAQKKPEPDVDPIFTQVGPALQWQPDPPESKLTAQVMWTEPGVIVLRAPDGQQYRFRQSFSPVSVIEPSEQNKTNGTAAASKPKS